MYNNSGYQAYIRPQAAEPSVVLVLAHRCPLSIYLCCDQTIPSEHHLACTSPGSFMRQTFDRHGYNRF